MSVTINGTNGLTFNDASTQNTAATGFGFKNRLINGDIRIDQRNVGTSVSPSGSAVYVADRWKIQVVSGTAQQISSTLSGSAYSLKYTSSGSNSYMQLGQQIEFVNCSDLQNQTVVISFKAKANNTNSGSTALTVRTRTSATLNGAALFSGSNSDTSITLTTSEALYTVTRTPPSTFGALSVEFVLGSHVSGDGFEITCIQLEKGSTATSFDYRDYGSELVRCQRYFEKSFNQNTVPAHDVGGLPVIPIGGSLGCGGNAYWIVSMKVTKRISTYTVRWYDPIGAHSNAENWVRYITACNSGAAAGPNSNMVINSNTNEHFAGYSQLGTGVPPIFYWTVDAEF